MQEAEVKNTLHPAPTFPNHEFQPHIQWDCIGEMFVLREVGGGGYLWLFLVGGNWKLE